MEEVCQRQGFVPPEDYKLVSQGRKELDLSLSVRYASLPNNAKLELVKSASSRTEQDVVIALQLASGERYQESFKPSTSLWDILLVFESKISTLKDSLTRVDTNQKPALHPVCIYMREEVIGEQALKATTLKKLALTSGKAIFRHLHRSIDEGALGAIMDKVEKEKQKQAKLEEIALKNSELQQLDGQQKIMEVTDTALTSRHASATIIQSMDVDEQVSISPDLAIEVSSSDSKLQENANILVTSNSADLSPPVQDRHSSGIDELRNLNIPGVEIFTPDDFSDLSPQEQAIAQRLAARFLPHLQAMVDNPQTSASRPDPIPESSQDQSASGFENFKFPESTRGLNLQSNQKETSVLESPCNREAILFDGNELLKSDTEANNDDLPDDFFDVTKNDVKMMYRDLQNAVKRFEDQPLLTTTMRNERMESLFDDYDRIVIRVQFPDRSVLQGLFRPREPVSALQSFVQENLENKDDKFYLYTAPPKEILKDGQASLARSKLAPAALVYYGCEKQRSIYISNVLRSSKKTRTEADLVVSQILNPEGNPRPGPSGINSNPSLPVEAVPFNAHRMSAGSSTSSQSSSSRQSLSSGSQIPKWLRLGKK